MTEGSYRDGIRAMLPLLPAIVAFGAFRGGRLRRLLEARLLVDESWALSSRDGRFDRRGLVGAGALLYLAWNTGTAAGAARVVDLLAPALLAALVATQAFAADEELVLDERAAGLAAAGVAIVLRAPLLIVVLVAAATAAVLRAVS